MDLQQAIELTDRQDPCLDQWLEEAPLDQIKALAENVLATKEALRREKQLLFYQPVSEEARKFHLSRAQQRIIIGGNGSSKTETDLVDLIIEMTGWIPLSLKDEYPREKLRPPIHARLIVESLTNTWEQTIKPKLQWDHWTGLKDGIHGHWGWVPREFLKKGSWEESWSEKYRTLTLRNGSTLHVMSHDQDPKDAASASLHRIGIDEGPKASMWRENMMRLREGGYIVLAMTPPDDESKSWDAAWVFEDLYEKGLPGPGKDPEIDSFTFFTENNPYLAPDFISKATRGLTPEQKETRFHGRFMHLGGRIYPNYTDQPQMWCFTCNKSAITDGKLCAGCGNSNVVEYCHLVEPFEFAYRWPIVFLLDPHPRKAIVMSWVAIDPADDWWQVAELQVDAEPVIVRDEAYKLERAYGLSVASRIIDPKMAGQAAHNAGPRGISVRDEYDAVGLRCANADSSFEVGKDRVREMLKPDSRTRRPRLHVFKTCPVTNKQMKNYSWDEWARYSSDNKDPKAQPRAKGDDFPNLIKYLANARPTFSGLTMGIRPIMGTRKKRVGPYG